MKTVIIIPTYNEKKNIGRLIEVLETEVFPKVPKDFDMHILVVDDSSPDGTAVVVEKIQKQYANVHLLLNKVKAGLGGAYMKGMTYAVDEMGADVMFEMDADFSHDPSVVPAFLEKISQGYELVLGSRYIKGGSIPDDWGLHRKLLSSLGNLTIRIVLTNFAIHDWTTGYRALTKEVFQILRHEMKRREFSGYTWQIGFLHKSVRNNFKIAEVPIKFIDREYGKSKLGMEYIKNTLLYIFTIRIKEHKRFIKFGIVGTIGFIVNFTALEVFHRGFELSPNYAAALGAELAIISNFSLNNLWTFKDRQISTPGKVVGKFVQFNLTSLGAIFIQWLGETIGIYFWGLPYYRLYFIASVGVGLLFNYVMYTKVIWRQESLA